MLCSGQYVPSDCSKSSVYLSDFVISLSHRRPRVFQCRITKKAMID